MKALLFFVILGLVTPLSAQFIKNDFSNPDLTGWLGDVDKFVVTAGQLQLSDQAAGSSNTTYLSIEAPTSTLEETIWESWVRLDFSPSASNFARIYLTASNANLSGEQEAYYLKIGGISGSNDAIELYRQDGNSSTVLLSGTSGAVGSSPALANIQVSRSTAGLWQLRVDYAGAENFQLEGEVLDNTYPVGKYFGYYCQYSSTRADAFAFDNLLVDPLFEDQTPPVLLSARAIDQNTAIARFDEVISLETATNNTLFDLSNGFANPTSSSRSVDNPAEVMLTWSQAFTNLTTYTLTTTGVSDAAGNSSASQSAEFTYLDLAFPQVGDLQLTEIMVDPSPPVGLPNVEYIELYNSSDQVLELEGIGISAGSTPKIFPSFQLLPGAYLLVVDDDDQNLFTTVSNIVGINGLPAMTNSGDQLILTNRDGAILADLTYDDSWYGDAQKEDGGWSLEVIQVAQILDCPGNWTASIAPNGGTPGAENSVNGQSLETNGPILLYAFAESETEIILVFDEPLDFSSASEVTAYSIDGNLSIDAAFPQAGNREILLNLASPMQAGIIYQVTVNTSITDCLGNAVTEVISRPVGLASMAEAGDLVINEILFSPNVRSDDFIEIYNRSDKTINLRDMRIHNPPDDSTARFEEVEQDFLIFPGEYVVITEDAQDILNQYTVNFPERLLENPLPTLGDEGNLFLSTPSFITLDSFAYSDDLHSPLLDDDRGVSLERVDANAPTNSPGNWHSAAGSVGFATPTDKNSQLVPPRDSSSSSTNVITLPQKRFSPDSDGFEDVLLLEVETDRSGYLANIQIFDANGRLTRRLLRNEILPTQGLYKWDGTHEDGRKARIGIYVLWVELLHPDGTVEHWKESFVLAGQLE